MSGEQEMSAMELRQHHKEELRAQMAANEERQKRKRAEYLLEGEKTRQKLQAEKDFIEVSLLRAVVSLHFLWTNIVLGLSGIRAL